MDRNAYPSDLEFAVAVMHNDRYMPRQTAELTCERMGEGSFRGVCANPLVYQDWPECPRVLEAVLRRGAALSPVAEMIEFYEGDTPLTNGVFERVLSLPGDIPAVRKFAKEFNEIVGQGPTFGEPVLLPPNRRRAGSGEPHGLAAVMRETLFETGDVRETIERAFAHPEEVWGVLLPTEELMLDLWGDHMMVGPVGAALVAMYAQNPRHNGRITRTIKGRIGRTRVSESIRNLISGTTLSGDLNRKMQDALESVGRL